MLDSLSLPLIVAGSFIGLLIAYLLLLCTCYVTCGMDDALVRSGMGGLKVAIQTGLWRFPLIHKLSQVSLRTVSFEISSTEIRGGMRDKELSPIIFQAEIYIHIPAKEDYVIAAARTLGGIVDRSGGVTVITAARTLGEIVDRQLAAQSDALEELSKDKVEYSLRHVATTMTIDEIKNDRLRFTASVADHVENDLKRNGLALESIAIESLG